ncbi:MAG TPA: TraM recognition domain-containing protein [Acidimicrobiales bacterium]|nr:TraM recognition domain-containing protein [Acidimicrobiales bacterium]
MSAAAERVGWSWGDGDSERALRAVHAASRAAGGGIYLGEGVDGWAWSGPGRSTLVLGPSRSGKTSSLVIPNVLSAEGAVVTTSTKPDVLRATAALRSGRGSALLYDPSGSIELPPGVTRVGWSPVTASSSWDGALLNADTMVRASRPVGGPGVGSPVDSHWVERASALLAPLLHAASIADEPMSTVLGWVDRHQGADALDTLANRPGAHRAATDLLAGILATDHREQSGIWSTASGVLAAYRSSSALASTEPPFVDADSFCAGSGTLYICATGRQQQVLAPLVVGVLGEIREAAYRRASSGAGSPPVLLAIDEAANIAPIPDLPAMVSEGAGQGLLTLVCLQDLSQARARWGPQAEGFVSLFGTTVVLGGIADIPTLQTLSSLAGDEERRTRTVGSAQGGDGRVHPSFSDSAVTRRRLPMDAIARGRPGSALAVDARNRFGWVALSPAHLSSPWRELLGPDRQGSLRDRHRLPSGRGDETGRATDPLGATHPERER